jgi:hypothetical protein
MGGRVVKANVATNRRMSKREIRRERRAAARQAHERWVKQSENAAKDQPVADAKARAAMASKQLSKRAKRRERRASARKAHESWIKPSASAVKHTAYFAREGRWVYTWVRNHSGVVVAEGKWPEDLKVPATITPAILNDPVLAQKAEVVAAFDSLNLGLLRAKTAVALEVLVQLYFLWNQKATFGSAAQQVAWSAVVAGSDGLLKAGLSFAMDAAAKALWGTSTITVAGQAIGGAPAAAGIFVAETCYEVMKVITGHTTKKEAAKAILAKGVRLGLVWGGAEAGAAIGLSAGGPAGGVVGAFVGGVAGFAAAKLGEYVLS